MNQQLPWARTCRARRLPSNTGRRGHGESRGASAGRLHGACRQQCKQCSPADQVRQDMKRRSAHFQPCRHSPHECTCLCAQSNPLRVIEKSLTAPHLTLAHAGSERTCHEKRHRLNGDRQDAFRYSQLPGMNPSDLNFDHATAHTIRTLHACRSVSTHIPDRKPNIFGDFFAKYACVHTRAARLSAVTIVLIFSRARFYLGLS